MPAVLPSTSREYIRVAVTATGVDYLTLPTLSVQFAFMTDRITKPTTFVTGSWEPNFPSPALARCLVGPGGTIALATGTYFVWIEIIGAVEQPIRQVGSLVIT